jgi:hypothetical protein
MKRQPDFRDQLPRGLSGFLIDADRPNVRLKASQARARERAHEAARLAGPSFGEALAWIFRE